LDGHTGHTGHVGGAGHFGGGGHVGGGVTFKDFKPTLGLGFLKITTIIQTTARIKTNPKIKNKYCFIYIYTIK
jgi:hypothetical protein